MNTTQSIYYLKRLGLPYATKAQRASSWRVFQSASVWHHYAHALDALKIDGVPGVKTKAHVDKAKANRYRIAPHFRLSEFRCGCRGKYHSRNYVRVRRELLHALEAARAKYYPSGLTIVSGYRCAKHNAKVGGVANSSHRDGRAADIPRRVYPASLRGLGFRGIGYKATHGLVTHVDVATRLSPDTVFKEN